MNIRVLENPAAYREIAWGEVIEKGGSYFMKTSIKNMDAEEPTYEAVDLKTGESEPIGAKELVWRVNAELTIKQ